jgi:lambda family phage tail tape measure protein
MAKTLDELVLKVSVEGTAQVTETTTAINNLDTTTQKTASNMKQSQQTIRNVGYQIQDLSVQIAGGTSAFVALGQQLPQLLSGFGTLGIVLGAVAAIGIPVLREGLKFAGVDMRNLKERTDDLEKSVKAYHEAQQANLPTLQGLGQTYGSLTNDAKAFFEVQQKLTEQKTNIELTAALKELKTEYQRFTPEAEKAAKTVEAMAASRGAAEGALYLGQVFKSWSLGLTIEQAKEVATRLKDIDKASPEEAAKRINEILTYLKDSGVETSKFKRFFDESIDPILKINNQILEMKKNLAENARQASELNAAMLGIQSSFQPDINAARRNFDQVTAARKEGEMKVAEFTKQIQEKTSKDQVDRSKELAAFTLRVNQDVDDKIKDISKGQYESYRASMLTNDAKLRQLELESKIISIQDAGRYDMAFNVKYEEDAARAALEYQNTLYTISELRRKNTINATQEGDLRKQAMNIQKAELANAEQARNKAVKDFVESQNMANMKKAIEDQIARAEKLGDELRKINDLKIGVGFEREQMGRSPLEQQMARIKEDARKAALEAGRAFSAGFNTEDGLTPEKAQELADGLDKIAQGYANLSKEQVDNLMQSRTWSQGWKEAFNKYADDANNSAEQAKTYFDTFTKGFEDAMVTFVQTGKLSFHDLANSIIADFVRIQARQMMTSAFGANGVFGGFFAGIGKMLGFADGGMPPVGVPSIVGERGPELFIPRTAGTIIANDKLGHGGYQPITNVNYNIQAVDAVSFKQLVARDPQFIYNVTEKGRRSVPGGR